jgi:CTP synthase (UTP-ammonia lyase)
MSPTPPAAAIALIGDRDPSVAAHQAIPLALSLARDAAGIRCDWTWIHTSTLTGDVAAILATFDGVWCVPKSPYQNTAGAIAAIRVARETGRPYLGTCGGFQHALLEYAEAIWGVRAPVHAELDPSAPDPVIAPLTCGLVEADGEVRFTPGSRIAAVYGVEAIVETYHCRYGLNPRYAARLENGPLHVVARDLAGDVRAVELDGHPFFMATLYQPERSGLAGRTHPLIQAFVAATAAHASVRRR